MSLTYVQILGFVLAMLCMGCTTSIPPGAVAMTCSAATYRMFAGGGGSQGGLAGRSSCNMAKGPDGKEVPVGGPNGVLDTRVGQKLYCTETGGKITCPSVPLAAFSRTTPWFQLNPATFPPFVIPNPWWER